MIFAGGINMAANEQIANNANTANKTIRNFRTAPDIENFYRFVHENGLRAEAKKVLEVIVTERKLQMKKKKKTRGRKKKVLQ